MGLCLTEACYELVEVVTVPSRAYNLLLYFKQMCFCSEFYHKRSMLRVSDCMVLDGNFLNKTTMFVHVNSGYHNRHNDHTAG